MALLNLKGGNLMGKNPDGANKRFDRKKLEYTRDIKHLEEQLREYKGEIEMLKDENANHKTKIEQLSHCVETLLTYTKFSKEDIKRICDNDEQTAEALAFVLSKLKHSLH